MTVFRFTSHPTGPEQEAELREAWGADAVRALPEDLQAVWSQLPPGPELPLAQLAPLLEWLRAEARPGDLAWIQGEFGAVFWLADAAFKLGLVPVYATTRREARSEPQPDGSVRNTHVFQHAGFRRYQYFDASKLNA